MSVQLLPGILRDKTIDEKFMYIPNEDAQISSSIDYYQWLKRLDTQLNDKLIKIQQKSTKLNKNEENVIMKLWGLV